MLQALVVGFLQRGTSNNAWFFVLVSIFLAILLFFCNKYVLCASFQRVFKEIISKSSMRAHLRKKKHKFRFSLGYINPMSKKKNKKKQVNIWGDGPVARVQIPNPTWKSDGHSSLPITPGQNGWPD